MTLIVGIDPGQTTGVCVYYDSGQHVTWYWEQFGPEEHHEALWRLLIAERPDYLVVERFSPRPNNKAADYTALEYIGVAKTWSAMNGQPLRLQNVSDAKNVWPNPKLTRLKIPGLPKANPAHMRDATRHVLLFLQKELGESRYFRCATQDG